MELIQKILDHFGLKPKTDIDLDFSSQAIAVILLFNAIVLMLVFKLRKKNLILAIIITSFAFLINLIAFVYGINYFFY